MMTKDKLRQLTGDERLGQMRESEYLGAEDIDDGTEPVLTIAGLWYGSVTLQRGKENKDVLSFKEERVPGILQVRPLIVNSTNRKTLRKLFGDAKASTLVGKQIQLYVDHNVRDPQDGGMTDGIRIRPYKPRVQKQEPRCAGTCSVRRSCKQNKACPPRVSYRGTGTPAHLPGLFSGRYR